MTLSAPDADTARGTLDLVVTGRVRESRNVLSLVLRRGDGGDLPAFRAGQHLPIWLGLPRRNIATYTISSPDHDRSHYRISVKLEPEGLGGSYHLHHKVPIGTVLKTSAPRGTFVVEPAENPVLLLTGGIGVTPALAMLHALAREGRREVYFLHACNDRDEHSFASEVAALAAGNARIHLLCAYANGTDEDIAKGHCHRLGMIDRAVLRAWLPLDAYHAYLCGPPGFMAAMGATLRDLGLPQTAIRTETFATAKPAVPPAAPDATTTPARGPRVTFARSGRSAPWIDTAPSLLEFAEAQGLQPDFSCRAGVCGSCACRVLEGEVDYLSEPLESPAPGEVLLCCATPRGQITLDL